MGEFDGVGGGSRGSVESEEGKWKVAWAGLDKSSLLFLLERERREKEDP